MKEVENLQKRRTIKLEVYNDVLGFKETMQVDLNENPDLIIELERFARCIMSCSYKSSKMNLNPKKGK